MKTYRVANDAQAAYALDRAIRGDVIDFNGVFSANKTIRTGGVTLDGYDATIRGNATSTHGIMVHYADDVTVRGFGVEGVGRGSAIVIVGSDDAFVFQNHAHDNSGHGIVLLHSDGARVARNLVEDNAAGSDRYHAYSGISDAFNNGPEGNVIRANIVRRNVNAHGKHSDGFGILKDGGVGDLTIEGNRVTGNGSAGIGAVNAPNGPDLIGNLVYGNGADPERDSKYLAEVYFRNVQGADMERNRITAEKGHYAFISSGDVRNTADFDGNRIVGPSLSYGAPHHEMPGAENNHIGVQSHALDW
jgi:parallel beta-helix repeat protein